jgi:hypothetical protein
LAGRDPGTAHPDCRGEYSGGGETPSATTFHRAQAGGGSHTCRGGATETSDAAAGSNRGFLAATRGYAARDRSTSASSAIKTRYSAATSANASRFGKADRSAAPDGSDPAGGCDNAFADIGGAETIDSGPTYDSATCAAGCCYEAGDRRLRNERGDAGRHASADHAARGGPARERPSAGGCGSLGRVGDDGSKHFADSGLRFAGSGRGNRSDDHQAQPGRARAEPDHAVHGLEKEIEDALRTNAKRKVISKAEETCQNCC